VPGDAFAPELMVTVGTVCIARFSATKPPGSGGEGYLRLPEEKLSSKYLLKINYL
jgi:hypothetical protein